MRGRRPARTRSRPGTSSCPTSWSTAPPAATGPSSSAAPSTCPSPTPTAPASPLPSPGPTGVRRRRDDGRHRRPTLLHPRRVARLRRPRLDVDQHDRAPEAALARELRMCSGHDRARHRHGRRRRDRGGGRRRRRSSRCSRPTPSGSRRSSRTSSTDAARPRRLHLRHLGRRSRPAPTRSRESPADRLRRLHRLGDRSRADRGAATRWSGST